MTSLLDTNIVSQILKPRPDIKVMEWLDKLQDTDAFLSVITIQEIRTGIELLPLGLKRSDLESWLITDIQRAYKGRILPVTEEVADMCGRLVAAGRKGSAAPEIADALLAATAKVHDLQLATLNRKHFERFGVRLVQF